MRGEKIHLTLFGPEVEVADAQEDIRGRDPELIAQRNEHILYRYLDYYRIDRKLAYPWVVKQLSIQFYLSCSTISQLIAANEDTIVKMKKEGLTRAQLNRKYLVF